MGFVVVSDEANINLNTVEEGFVILADFVPAVSIEGKGRPATVIGLFPMLCFKCRERSPAITKKLANVMEG